MKVCEFGSDTHVICLKAQKFGEEAIQFQSLLCYAIATV